MTVTIKTAIDMAIEALQEKEQTKEVRQAIHKLQALAKRELITNWSQKAILEALENWRKVHDGKTPTVTNLVEPGMPGANIIKKHFGVSASSFLRKQYPEGYETQKMPPNRYGFTCQQDWLDCFRRQFEKHCKEEGFSSKTYNILRDKNTPLWATIAYHVGTSQWGELMKKAGVKYPLRHENAPADMSYKLSSYSPTLEKWDACLNKAIEHRKALEEMLERTAVRTRYLEAYMEQRYKEDPHISRISLETLHQKYHEAPVKPLSEEAKQILADTTK